ncbi:MAG TPA: hypothetical protein VFS18_05795, partial [Actinomycetota bacterium]|nr:hypothetical protein [Actinomycetota bacterium]
EGDVVWASDRGGVVWRVDPSGDGDPSGSRLVPPGDHRLDLALARGTLWVADPSGDNLYSVTDSDEVTEHPVAGEPITDVAASGAMVWTLGAEGTVRAWSDDGSSRVLATVAVAALSDLAAGFNSVWVSSGDGVVYKIDPATGDVEAEARVGDSYADLALADDAVIVLAAKQEGSSELVELDPITGEVRTEPLEIRGEPVDVTADADSIWVPDQRDGAVLRIQD